MTFLSVEFLSFFIVVLLFIPLCRTGPHLFIALVSTLFYLAAGGVLIAIVLISSAIDYFCSAQIAKKNRAKLFLGVGISLNLFFLILVKINFWTTSFSDSTVGQLMVPIGISFYTLQSIGYLIDLYKNKIKPCQTFLEYYSYILFFPQLIAGPIERAGALIPQLKEVRFADFDKALHGLKLFSFGVYLKLVVSNRLAQPVQTISESHIFDLVFFLNGLVIFLFLYADFFAYTLMARGIASILNVDLQINFNRPFHRKNLIGFWQSWHISLTKWMTDYFYIPLMLKLGNKYVYKLIFTVLTMVLVGLWHGFALNFVIFAIIHGVLMQALPRLQAGLEKIRLRWLKVDGRLGLVFALCVTGNIFLSGSVTQFESFLSFDNFVFFSEMNWSHYQSLGFLVGVGSLFPLMYFEFVGASLIERSQNYRQEILMIVAALCLTVFFYETGADHVYFRF